MALLFHRFHVYKRVCSAFINDAQTASRLLVVELRSGKSHSQQPASVHPCELTLSRSLYALCRRISTVNNRHRPINVAARIANLYTQGNLLVGEFRGCFVCLLHIQTCIQFTTVNSQILEIVAAVFRFPCQSS